MWTSHTDIYAPLLLSLPPSPHPTLLGYHRALNWTPCAIQQPPTSYLFCMVMYICQYYSTSSSHSPSPAMSTSPFSASAMTSMLNNKNFAIKNYECGCCVNQQGMFTWSLSWCCYLCTHSVAITSLTLSHKTFSDAILHSPKISLPLRHSPFQNFKDIMLFNLIANL